LLNSRTSYPSHQFSRLLARRSGYCSTSPRLLTWSVLPSSSSGRKTATPTQSSDQSTSLARSCQNPRHAMNPYRSYCMQCSSPPEATTLLPRVLDLCRHRLPARRHLVEPRCYWKDLQVGSRTRRPQHRLQAMNSHQVVGTSRLHGGVAGKSATYSNRVPRALGDVLRRLAQA
jgi:hypothetical protein